MLCPTTAKSNLASLRASADPRHVPTSRLETLEVLAFDRREPGQSDVSTTPNGGEYGRSHKSGKQAGRGDRARDAAQVATDRVITLAKEEDAELVAALEKMRAEAAETERRCADLAGTFEGKKTAILEEARTTKSKGAEMLKIYLDRTPTPWTASSS